MKLAKTALDDPHYLSQALELRCRTMATGGLFRAHKIRHAISIIPLKVGLRPAAKG